MPINRHAMQQSNIKLDRYCWNSADTMGDLHVVGRITKLNNKNYNTWATCMESYLQGQDL
ncbi:unnamed protein product [Prunus armeniaca]|uniref:DUF4219 domain-containing protein n=1 Tax=Prunus armeniaca TaxID=36596 RepID=A0A6J5W0F4_PRUAR|nr:unnamed protein product [Prunus armeniaca]